ncbi:MAG: SLBB domain-containing protein [Armatimonadetes bacterium]|nr:SLBB domain-containing protein [Armatimonadota bacterium]
MKIVRADPAGGEKAIVFDLDGYQHGRVTELPELRDGDLVTIEPNRITVVGAVTKPGPVDLPLGASVVDAVSAAGGPLDNADLSRVVITRPGPDGPAREVVNLEQYLYQPQQAPPLPPVRAGDVVAVEAGTVDTKLAYVLGAVQKPGVVTIPAQEASLMYALAQAGGPIPQVGDATQVRILHPGPQGAESTVFDLQSLTAGNAPAGPIPVIRPGDVVWVGLLDQPGKGVLVLGAVTRQGRYPITSPAQTVMDTLGLAGGILANTKASKTRLIRADGVTVPVDLAAAVNQGGLTPVVKDGDVLVVAADRGGRSLWDSLLSVFPFVSLLFRP